MNEIKNEANVKQSIIAHPLGIEKLKYRAEMTDESSRGIENKSQKITTRRAWAT